MNPDVETFLSSREPAIAELTRHLSEVILALLPEATITMDDENLGFGRGTGYKGLIFTVAPHTTHVTLGVAGGASLPDPDGLLEGSGKVHRHVKLRGLADVDRPELRALMESAIAAKS
ncbi:MAG TPA: DUF1801 domain-containing protein [Candidatus Limnocylindrales bacterium]|nr:DUF1801 domain-containing protein [Candidatus Limnocylindrales bacterium]